MADKIDIDVPENEEEKVETPEQNKSKTFSQEELNKIVQTRLKDEAKKSEKLATDWEAEKSSMQSQIEGLSKIVQKMVDDLVIDIPENYRKLFDSLSLEEKYEFLTDDKNKISKKEIPQTPKPVGDTRPTAQSTKTERIF